ncbi:MAG TPA: sugar ABC transporter permease [Ktedonobacteraceae bacterium]|nr:sugar ABC transporter permease [Ktedonobacteraceae bacterium]
MKETKVSSAWEMQLRVEDLAPPRQHSKVELRNYRVLKENVAAYLFLLPWFVGLVVFTVGPMMASLYYSFTSYDLLSAPQWIGLGNYIRMFTQDQRYLTALRVTFIYVFASVPMKLAFALFLAVFMSKGLRALGLYRAIYYVPSLLGGSVAIAILWKRIFDIDGIVNQALGLVGVSNQQSWISTPNTAMLTLILLAVWQFGSPMLIFVAGLKQIPRELYDSAQVDGAGKLSQFFQITLPLLTPLIFFNLILQMIAAFQVFTSALIVTNGGPADATLFYTLYLYQQGFGNYQMGYASAMAWVLMAIIMAFTAMTFFTSRYWVFYQDGRN